MSHLNRNRLAALFQVEPIHPWKICGKTRFEASRVVFWSLLFYKDLKLTTKLFTGRTLHGLLIQMAKLFACKVQACTGSKIFGFKKWHSSLDFYFLLSLLPTFFTFLTSFCFSFAGDLVGFILLGKVFAKLVGSLIGSEERKGLSVVEQDFHGNFQVNVSWFFAFFFGALDWTMLILVWFERSLLSAQVNGQSCPWTIKLISAQVEEGTWIRMFSYGQFRDQWVNFPKLPLATLDIRGYIML